MGEVGPLRGSGAGSLGRGVELHSERQAAPGLNIPAAVRSDVPPPDVVIPGGDPGIAPYKDLRGDPLITSDHLRG
jgi:hypothetical protein